MVRDLQEEYYEDDGFWDDGALQDPGNQKRVESTINLLPPETTSLLDVGCGNGIFGNRLMDLRPNISIIGVDRSDTAMGFTKFPTRKASIDSLPFEDASFDAVSCLQVLEHLPNSVFESALSELARVSLRHLIIGVPFEEVLERDLTQCPQCKTIFNFNLHLRSFSLHDMADLFGSHGFSMVDHVFPAERTRRKYVNEIAGFLKGQRRDKSKFMSPICPICAYRNPMRNNPTPRRETSTKVGAPGVKRKVAKGLLSAATSLFPKQHVKGYWIIALYERSA